MSDPNAPQDPKLRLELALAMARERLAEAHLAQALEFVRHCAGQVTGARALSMYSRLHHLTDEQHRQLVNGVLAAYGRENREDDRNPGDGEIPWSDTSTVLDRVLRRLRGRRNRELRQWVELHTGHAERMLLEVHVQNALRCLEARGEGADVAVAVYAYMDAVSLRESLFEALHIMVLDRLYHRRLAGPAAVTSDAWRSGLRVVGSQS